MANEKKPNILFIMADDIGWFNISAYNHGIMGYRTPNIDRIAKEGANVHRLLWAAKLHGRPGCIYYRPITYSHGTNKSWYAGCSTWA